MPRRLSPLAVCTVTVLILTISLSSASRADGVAIFASLLDEQLAESMRAQLRTTLGVEVEASIIVINGTRWTRLHSAPMAERDSRALVAKAAARGYTAWYNGSGNSLASSSSDTAVRYVESSSPSPQSNH